MDGPTLAPGQPLLRDSQYRELFETIREGFFVAEVVRDERGRVIDFVFLEVNNTFARQTPQSPIGRRVTEIVPGFPRSTIERYGTVVDTGHPAILEVELPGLLYRSYEARAHPLGGDRFAVLYLEITERKRIAQALEESRAALATIVNFVDQMIWSTRPDGFPDFYNDRWYEYTGTPPGATEGDEWIHAVHPDDRERAWARWRHSIETGEPYEIECRLRHRSGEYRWALGRAHPVRNDAGEIVRWMGTCTDIHTQKALSEQLELASQELGHRLKNMFAVISGLVSLSAQQHPEHRAFAESLCGRITALSEAQDYARPYGRTGGHHSEEATVLGLVGLLLRPYELEAYDRIRIFGDDAPIKRGAATPISLAVHELATNAAKYGAFSVPTGRVEVRGERSDTHFTFYWSEHGGPPVREPDHFGFGTRLVDLTLRRQLGGELVRKWLPQGLEVCVSAPIDQIVAQEHGGATKSPV